LNKTETPQGFLKPLLYFFDHDLILNSKYPNKAFVPILFIFVTLKGYFYKELAREAGLKKKEKILLFLRQKA